MKNRPIALFVLLISLIFILTNLLQTPAVKAVEGQKVSVEETAPPPEAEGTTKAGAEAAGPAETVEAEGEEVAPSTAVAKEEVPAAEEEEAGPIVEPGNVTVNFKGADIRTVLAYLAEVSGVDIVPAPDVKGPVDLKLTNKPWKVALDIIVRNYGFAYEREGDIIRVVTIDKLRQEELATQAFNLNYGKAKDVVASIKNIVTDRGKVMYDDRTNVVLVTDIPTNLYKIGEVVNKLDKRTEQVLIEARVIETVLSDDEKLGIDWNIKFSASGARRPTTLPFDSFKPIPFGTKLEDGLQYFPQVLTTSPTTATGTGSITTSTTAAEFPGTAAGMVSFPFAPKDSFTFGTLDFSEFRAVLEFLKARSGTDIVSNPRIATLNNSEALINVGQTLNLPKFERNSTTGKMEITGYDAKELGIILKVTPHINEKGEIVVDLAPVISDLLRYDTLDPTSGIVAPVFSSRQAKTQVMIKDGETIFIGGLIKENNVDTRKKMPFFGDLLGDVPYLGLFFSKKEITKQKTELIFFITVNLMSADKVIKDVPQSNKAYVPMYVLTQEEGKKRLEKKKLNKRF